ncbi:hypothetical protein ID866_9318 [Astraeus odoratus]|nr:hypothetical protein ID866_9318 [Astraeus odoratus]
MPAFSRIIQPNLVDLDIEGLTVKMIKISDLNQDLTDLSTVVERNEGRPLGLSATYSPFGGLRLLAIADGTTVVIIDFESDNSKNNGRDTPPIDTSTTGRDYLSDHVLRRTAGFVYAFDMGPLALALWQSHDLRIQQAIDMQSAGPPTSRSPFLTISLAVGDMTRIFKSNIRKVFDDYVYHIPDDVAISKTTTPLAQRASVTHYISQLGSMEDRLAKVPPVDTFKLSDTVLRFLAKTSIDAFQLEEEKPKEVTRTVAASFTKGKKNMDAKFDRYQNKIRGRKDQEARVRIPATSGVGAYTISATISAARAEKLAAFDLFNWKLLVSKEFYEFWHEHLYSNLLSNVIVSEEFSDRGSFFSQISGCPVILCTLSMLSSHKLMQLGVFRVIPLQNIVVDEASQIEIGDYIPLFATATTIRKVTFIGDDKQLPPHGQEKIGGLQSIFEVDHLHQHKLLLNIQYRMPPQIGEFISQSVYDSLLESNADHYLSYTEHMTCRFVNVPGQQVSHGTSWKNLAESKAILQLASIFQAQGKKFKIITPYDAQRTSLENGLKNAELQWEDKCFNVDSFQGNEEDYIIISLVRSLDLGFLSDLRRTNVMLTRCKRGMVIFTSKLFMEKYGKDSLVGSLLQYYDNDAWIEVQEMSTTYFP